MWARAAWWRSIADAVDLRLIDTDQARVAEAITDITVDDPDRFAAESGESPDLVRSTIRRLVDIGLMMAVDHPAWKWIDQSVADRGRIAAETRAMTGADSSPFDA